MSLALEFFLVKYPNVFWEALEWNFVHIWPVLRGVGLALNPTWTFRGPCWCLSGNWNRFSVVIKPEIWLASDARCCARGRGLMPCFHCLHVIQGQQHKQPTCDEFVMPCGQSDIRGAATLASYLTFSFKWMRIWVHADTSSYTEVNGLPVIWLCKKKNTPDKSRGKNLGQEWKDLTWTNVLWRSTCRCMWGGGFDFLLVLQWPLRRRSYYERVCLSVHVCVDMQVCPCLCEMPWNATPIRATQAVCNSDALGMGWSLSGVWGKPYWCGVIPLPQRQRVETNLWDTWPDCGGTERPR